MPKAKHGDAYLASRNNVLAYLRTNPGATYRQIAEGIGLPESYCGHIHGMCDELLTEGLLFKRHEGARALAVTRKGVAAVRKMATEIAE